MSTQTNAHIPEGAKKGDEKSKVSSGVSHDWWRVVDAVSNYNETDVSQQVQAGPAGGSKEITRGSPDQEKKPLEMWDTWNGTSPGARLASSFLSMFIALGALTVPGILALLVGALTIALEISVLVTPVAFLFAFGNDTMFEWFKGFYGYHYQYVGHKRFRPPVDDVLNHGDLVYSGFYAHLGLVAVYSHVCVVEFRYLEVAQVFG